MVHIGQSKLSVCQKYPKDATQFFEVQDTGAHKNMLKYALMVI